MSKTKTTWTKNDLDSDDENEDTEKVMEEEKEESLQVKWTNKGTKRRNASKIKKFGLSDELVRTYIDDKKNTVSDVFFNVDIVVKSRHEKKNSKYNLADIQLFEKQDFRINVLDTMNLDIPEKKEKEKDEDEDEDDEEDEDVEEDEEEDDNEEEDEDDDEEEYPELNENENIY